MTAPSSQGSPSPRQVATDHAALPMAARVVSTPGSEFLAQSRLAAPLAAQQVGLQLMGAVDTAMLGHFSSTALAGAGVGNGLVFAITCVGMGIVLGLDSVVPRAIGSGDLNAADRYYRAGLRLALVVGIPATLLVLASRWLLPWLGTDPEVAAAARAYIGGRALGVVPFLLSVAMRSMLAANGITRPLLIAMIGGNLINLVCDGLLIYGDDALLRVGLPAVGIPALGVLGAALATTGVQVGTCLVYALSVRRLRTGRGQTRPHRPLRDGELATLAHHGIPIGLQMFAEVGVFATSGVLAAQFGTAAAAAHSVAITLASFTFSAAVGIGSATAVRVGLAIGAGGRGALAVARTRGLVGISLGLAVMAAGALGFLVFPSQLAGWFTDRRDVLLIATPLLWVAALFQLSDGAQAVAAGALRGAGDTRSTLWANLIGHYIIGLPVSLLLGFGAGLGALGLWWGLSVGLTVTAVILVAKFLRSTRSSPLS
jgi:multidrug resistance protein, MATE family